MKDRHATKWVHCGKLVGKGCLVMAWELYCSFWGLVAILPEGACKCLGKKDCAAVCETIVVGCAKGNTGIRFDEMQYVGHTVKSLPAAGEGRGPVIQAEVWLLPGDVRILGARLRPRGQLQSEIARVWGFGIPRACTLD